MAELRFEAPLASFENEEWNEREDCVDANVFKSQCEDDFTEEPLQRPAPAPSEAENFKETCAGSLEDLVNSFDERISNCFCNFEEQAEKIAPVQVRTHEEVMSDCQMWWTITGNYGSILPINWSKDYIKPPPNKTIHLRDKQECEYPELYQSQEDLPQDFDMHSLIVATLHPEGEDKVETAEDVIQQIERMLKDPSPENHDDKEDEKTDKEDEQHLKVKAMLDKLPSYTEGEMKSMTVSDLQELYVEYRQANSLLSELLSSEQAAQEELHFDKELKNSFISLLLGIHKKLKDNNGAGDGTGSGGGGGSMKRKKKCKGGGGGGRCYYGGGHPVKELAEAEEAEENSSFLTTKIPYFPQDGPPTSDQLQIYIKILEAIGQDSSTVPTLLTNYILKVLCPAH